MAGLTFYAGIMETIVLSGRPGAADVDGALAEALRSAWGGTQLVWLAKEEAVTFDVPARPDTFDTARIDLDMRHIDLNVIPGGARPREMLLADMDSTMIRQECIDELADQAGVGAQVAEITARAMNGELDFDGALRTRVGLLKGLPVSIIDEVFEQRITFMPGGAMLLATMKERGAYAALVSGGFTDFTSRVGAALGFDVTRANRLLHQDDVLTGEVADPILGRDAKVTALHEFTAAQGLTAADVLAVGDGANDLGMLGVAGLGVALHAKPSVQAECDVRINHGDLTALLYLQGISTADFAQP